MIQEKLDAAYHNAFDEPTATGKKVAPQKVKSRGRKKAVDWSFDGHISLSLPDTKTRLTRGDYFTIFIDLIEMGLSKKHSIALDFAICIEKIT